MKCVIGIDLGSTTTKAVMLDLDGVMLGQGITNSRSNYEVASVVARQEAHTAARFRLLKEELPRALKNANQVSAATAGLAEQRLPEAFRLELYLAGLQQLEDTLLKQFEFGLPPTMVPAFAAAAKDIMAAAREDAPTFFLEGASRKSDFFRDLANEGFGRHAERVCGRKGVPFERMLGAFDRAILDVEKRVTPVDFGDMLQAAAARVVASLAPDQRAGVGPALLETVAAVAAMEIEEVAFVGTGYGRQTLPFPKEAVRSEILCHGRGAHKAFPGTRTVLDIGGQDTKAIQVDERGVVTSFQMNDRCAAGCGRYLGYIADELNIGLHELGPLALGAQKVTKVNSTCTVFAGAELRERLALGERREDILAGLHRAIMLRAMALLARSGGVKEQFTFTGGVCKNPMATRVLKQLVVEHYGDNIQLNIHPDSIYMGALGAALFALDDQRAGRSVVPGAIRDLYKTSAQGPAAVQAQAGSAP